MVEKISDKLKSPYTAAMTGCGFMWKEMTNILPLLMSPNSTELLKQEIIENKYLMMNTEHTRKRAMAEFIKRFNSVPLLFWQEYQQFSPNAQIVAMYYVSLKCYKLFFDLHLNLVLKRWNSVRQSVTRQDVLMEINEIASTDEFVCGWSDNTKEKVASSFLSFLRKAGFIKDTASSLTPIHLKDEEFGFYLTLGESWFLEACLLQPYEINRIKQITI